VNRTEKQVWLEWFLDKMRVHPIVCRLAATENGLVFTTDPAVPGLKAEFGVNGVSLFTPWGSPLGRACWEPALQEGDWHQWELQLVRL
jgi:hypothetical protein